MLSFKRKLIIVLILTLIISPIQGYTAEHNESLMLTDLFPRYEEFDWTYTGSVEYGHEMSIESIIENENTIHYAIEGSVHDASGGASDTDYSLNLDYFIESDIVIQTKDEEAMLDSKYDSIELIRTPLVEGTTWTQVVENPNGDKTTLTTTITDVAEQDGHKIFTVRYKDINSEYYEERKIQEGIGIVSFEKLMINEETTYTMGYSINEASSGVALDLQFTDVSGDDWYKDYVAKLVTMDLIDGYPDDTFRPNREISVAEFIKITVESLSYDIEQGTDEWYSPYVTKAIELDLIEANEFDDYDRPIERDEMTKIIVNALDDEPEEGTLTFSDTIEIEAEYKPYISTAVELGLIAGYPSDNTFRPDDISTRAEASKLFVLLVEDEIDIASFDKSDALKLEASYKNRLIQETEGDNWEVKDFETKESLVDHLAVIVDRQLAQEKVNEYYEYVDGELTLPPRDGPALIIEDDDYQLKAIHPRVYNISQKTSSQLRGDYTLTITYRYVNNQWIIKDRNIEIHDNN